MTNANKVIAVTKVFNHTSLFYPLATGATVHPTTQVSSSTILLLLPIVGNKKARFYGSPHVHNLLTNFHPNPSIGSLVESCGPTDGQTDRHDQPCMRLFRALLARNAQERLLYIRSCPRKWLGMEFRLGNPQPVTQQRWESPSHGRFPLPQPRQLR
jgi:hypothetical protein